MNTISQSLNQFSAAELRNERERRGLTGGRKWWENNSDPDTPPAPTAVKCLPPTCPEPAELLLCGGRGMAPLAMGQEGKITSQDLILTLRAYMGLSNPANLQAQILPAALETFKEAQDHSNWLYMLPYCRP